MLHLLLGTALHQFCKKKKTLKPRMSEPIIYQARVNHLMIDGKKVKNIRNERIAAHSHVSHRPVPESSNNNISIQAWNEGTFYIDNLLWMLMWSTSTYILKYCEIKVICLLFKHLGSLWMNIVRQIGSSHQGLGPLGSSPQLSPEHASIYESEGIGSSFSLYIIF